VPPELSAVILKALEKFPNDRYRSADEFREALVRVRPTVMALETKEKAFAVRPPMENLDDDIGEPVAQIKPSAQRRAGRARPAMAGNRGPLSRPHWDEAEETEDPRNVGGLEAAPSPGGSAAAALPGAPVSVWRARDLVMVGFLTFLMVAAAVTAVLFVFAG
jgi:hypothetical protein